MGLKYPQSSNAALSGAAATAQSEERGEAKLNEWNQENAAAHGKSLPSVVLSRSTQLSRHATWGSRGSNSPRSANQSRTLRILRKNDASCRTFAAFARFEGGQRTGCSGYRRPEDGIFSPDQSTSVSFAAMS